MEESPRWRVGLVSDVPIGSSSGLCQVAPRRVERGNTTRTWSSGMAGAPSRSLRPDDLEVIRIALLARVLQQFGIPALLHLTPGNVSWERNVGLDLTPVA